MEYSVRKALLLAASLSVVTGCNTPQKSDPTPQIDIEQRLSRRIEELQKIPSWIELKEVWQSLDAITPGDSTRFGGAYMGTLTSEKAHEYRKKLQKIRYEMGQLNQNKLSPFYDAHIPKEIEKKEIEQNRAKRITLLSDLEIDLLCDLLEYRIDMFVHGPRSMFTRMIVNTESPMVRNEKTVQALEKQVDLLLTLKKEQKISSKEYEKALANIQQRISEFAVSTIIREEYRWSSNFGFGSPLTDTGSIIKRQIQQLDAHYESIQKMLSAPQVSAATEKTYKGNRQEYNRTKEKLKELESIEPALSELITELQR